MTDNDVIEYITTYQERTDKRPIFKYYDDDIKKYILNRYSDSESYNESIYRIFHNIEVRPVCKYCGKHVDFINKGSDKKFQTYCCPKCRAKDISPFKQPEVQQKIKQTNLERYGVSNVFASQEIRDIGCETKLERYGNPWYTNTDKFHKTCFEKYGVSAPSKNKEIRKKQKQTCFEKYGGYWNKEQVSKTVKEKYGVKWYIYSDDLKSKANTDEAKQKQYQTKRQNDTLNKSKQEEECFNLLYTKYPDIVHQYRCERYPYNCDFYIPSLDLFIEYNGSHYHHGRPFLGTDEDIAELKKLQELANNSKRHKEGKLSQYDFVIYTWTDLDVRKRKIAKENNLNYIEFWNIDDVKKFISLIE